MRPTTETPPPLVIDCRRHMLERSVFEASTNRTVFAGFGATPAQAPRRFIGSMVLPMHGPEIDRGKVAHGGSTIKPKFFGD